jgi:hypothetical protein
MPATSTLRELALRAFLRATYGPVPSRDGAFGRSVHWDDDGSAVVRATLETGRPCLVARFGSTELACVDFYLRWRKRRLAPVPYLRQVRAAIRDNSGVFPTDDATLDRFCETYLSALGEVDVLGVWFNRGEDRVVGKYCPDASLVHLEALNAVIRRDPWTQALGGRRVLVVHPFSATIESQYRTQRERLFDNPAVLPEFELTAIQAVQSLGGEPCGFESWFDALVSMQAQVEAADFDVAIVGAGAYGLPLCAAIKRAGRQAVQMGGATQLLFGIIGRRWEVESPHEVALVVNEHWVRPSAAETPSTAAGVEGGCYW